MLNLIFTFGIISSLLFYELTEISPGGIIAPVYIALYINNPQKICIT
ncbi:MAG: poly-gamma-glutamate biosynthesis protein PgsC, partial [Fusobacteriales bacterium]